MLDDTLELEELLGDLEGPYAPEKVVTLAKIEKVFARLQASAILHMNSSRSESINYRTDYALWADELATKLDFELRLYDDDEAMDERLSSYASSVLIIKECLISLRHFHINEGKFQIDSGT